MIQVFGSNQKPVGIFQNYDELCQHFNAIESSKLLECSSCSLSETWSFTLYTHKRLSYIYYKTLEKSFSKVGKEAFEQELDLIEIYKGDFKYPTQIPVAHDVNIQELKENWCREYCDAHNYILVDYKNNFANHIGTNSIANTLNQNAQASL